MRDHAIAATPASVSAQPQVGAPTGRTVAGTRLIFWLFVALAIATAAALILCAAFVAPQYRITVYRALAGDLALPVIAWYAMKAIERRRLRKAEGFPPASPP